jgi:(2Fe-2S) ferredoxin
MSDTKMELTQIAEKLGVGEYNRHVFYCVGGSCATPEEGARGWEVLKKELKEKNLSLSTAPNACYRTKVGCLRVCKGGPILLVYPEGTWYHDMTAEKIPEFVQKHLIEGKPIEEWIFINNPLPPENKKE